MRNTRKSSPVPGMRPHASCPGAWVAITHSSHNAIKAEVEELKKTIRILKAKTAHLPDPDDNVIAESPSVTKSKKGKQDESQ